MTEELKGPLSEANVQRVADYIIAGRHPLPDEGVGGTLTDRQMSDYRSMAEDAIEASGVPEAYEALKEAATDLLIAGNNANDAAKTDSRWEGVAEKLWTRQRQCEAALKALGGGDA